MDSTATYAGLCCVQVGFDLQTRIDNFSRQRSGYRKQMPGDKDCTRGLETLYRRTAECRHQQTDRDYHTTDTWTKTWTEKTWYKQTDKDKQTEKDSENLLDTCITIFA